MPLNYECPMYYTPSLDNTECELITTAPPIDVDLMQCENGTFNEDTQLCDVRFTSPIDRSCPNREYLHDGNGNCIKTEIEEYYVAMSCPYGYLSKDRVLCERVVDTIPMDYTCEHLGSEWELENGDCVAEVNETHVPGQYCQSDFLKYTPETNDCRRTSFVPATPECPDEYLLVGGICVNRIGSTYTANYVCP